MSATPFDNPLYGSLFADRETADAFSAEAEITAMVEVEAALATAQAGLGMIPADAAAQIAVASGATRIPPEALAEATKANGVPVPALVAAFRAALPEHAAPYLHWGATSQDIVDTGLALRLVRVTERQRTLLRRAVSRLATVAEVEADTPMAGRTWGLAAVPTTMGAVAASWGWPLVDALERLDSIAPKLAQVSLSGAAGTLSAMGPDGGEVRAEMASALGLSDPGRSTHTDRAPLAEYAGWMATTAGSLAKMAEDILTLVRAGEVRLAAGGASSTMPQKSNPVAPSVIVALARMAAALSGAMSAALPHRDQRDGSAWMVEWAALPQLCIATSRALALAGDTAEALVPQREALARGIDPDGLGLIHAEAISFALARRIPRPEAQAAVKAMVAEALGNSVPLPVLAAARHPDADLATATDLARATGDAPADALLFARRTEEI